MTNRLDRMLKIPASVVASVVLFTTTLFLFGPFTIYWTNAIEFSNTSGDLAFVGLSLAALASLVLFLVFLVLKAVGPSVLEKGASLGTSLAFMMSVIGLSLPEMIILKKVLKLPLILIFVGIVAVGIMIVGFLFNLVY